MRSLNCAESRDIGHSHFRQLFVFCFFPTNSQTYFFQRRPGDFTDLHQALHTADTHVCIYVATQEKKGHTL